MYLNEYPNIKFINHLLETLKCEHKPMNVHIDYDHNEIMIQFRHDAFIDVFGDVVKPEEVRLDPGGFIYEKRFYDEKINIKVFTYIQRGEYIEKKMVKYGGFYRNGSL